VSHLRLLEDDTMPPPATDRQIWEGLGRVQDHVRRLFEMYTDDASIWIEVDETLIQLDRLRGAMVMRALREGQATWTSAT
jgi:hypothetical protein